MVMIGKNYPWPGSGGVGQDRRRFLWSLDPTGTGGNEGIRGLEGAAAEATQRRGGWGRAGDPDLDAVTRELARGHGHLVLVTGERGIGRSRRAMGILDDARSVSDVAVVGHHGTAESNLVRRGEGARLPGSGVRPGPGPSGELDVLGSAGRTGLDAAPDGTGVGLPADAAPAALSMSVPSSLLRAIARTRPDGPAARLMAEACDDPRLVEGMAEEIALVLVAEAARHPLTVLLEDIHLAEEGTHTFVDHLLTVVETVPLLVVVTAATGWGAYGPNAWRWRSWIGRHGALHLRVAPPSRRDLAVALGRVWQDRIPRKLLEDILTAARGNPRVAQEIAVWTLEGSSPDRVPASCLVRELVVAHDEDGILGALAVAGAPVGIRLVAAVASTSTTRVREVLDRAAAAGLVDRRSATGCGDTYVMSHPMYAAVARSLVPEEAVPALHLDISSALIGELGDDPAMALDIARHLVASGRPRADTAMWCLRAATWCESVSRLRDATEFAHAGLDEDPDLPTWMEIVHILTRCYRRLGEPRSAAGVLQAALRVASGQPRYSVEVAVELLELSEFTTVPGVQELLDDAWVSCPADRPDLLVRLAAIDAAMTFRRDPVAGQLAAGRAVQAAEPVDDGTARVRSLTVAARTLMDPARLGDLERMGAQLMREPVVDGLPATAAAALADADRGRLDSVVREYAWRESRMPDQVTRDGLTLLRAGVAALEGRKAVLTQALKHLSTSTTTHVALQSSLLPVLWTLSTRGTISAAGPDITGLPGADAMAELQWLGRLLSRPAPLHRLEVDLARQRLGGPAELCRPREDGTWTVRLAAAAVFGAVSRDAELCAVAAHALEPFAEQFVVVWPFVPVGPVGWFLAAALRVLGRQRKAVAALAAAQQACENLGAPGWMLRVAAERSCLLAQDEAPKADDLVRATVGPVVARRFPGVVAEIRCHLRGCSAGTGDRGRSSSAGFPPPDAVTGKPAAGRETTRGVRSPDCRPVPIPVQGAGHGEAAVRDPVSVSALTSRETDIMALAATGCTNQEIAKRLFLSVATVERHCTNLYRKLGVRNRAQALGILGRFGSPDGQE
jgi:DNA-binding CsgD family transcriptional regulator